MANKDRNKRSARKARAEERARVEAAQAASLTPEEKASQEKRAAKEAKAVAKQEKNKDKKPGGLPSLPQLPWRRALRDASRRLAVQGGAQELLRRDHRDADRLWRHHLAR